jgi:hypothetical protein
LLFGLSTPFAAAAEVFLELWSVFSRTAYYESSILLAALAASLAMLGPGVWSIDARLFGRRRIDFQPDTNHHDEIDAFPPVSGPRTNECRFIPTPGVCRNSLLAR